MNFGYQPATTGLRMVGPRPSAITPARPITDPEYLYEIELSYEYYDPTGGLLAHVAADMFFIMDLCETPACKNERMVPLEICYDCVTHDPFVCENCDGDVRECYGEWCYQPEEHAGADPTLHRVITVDDPAYGAQPCIDGCGQPAYACTCPELAVFHRHQLTEPESWFALRGLS
jgi:hypothetical protein